MAVSVYSEINYWVLDRVFRRKGENRYDTEECEVWMLATHDIFKGKQKGNIENLK